MRKNIYLSGILVLALAFFACKSDSTPDTGIFDSNGRYIGKYIDITKNKNAIEALQVRTTKGYIVSFYSDDYDLSIDSLFTDFIITTYMGWENDQDDTDRYIFASDREEDPKYVYFNSEDDDGFYDAQRFWVYGGEALLEDFTINGDINVNGSVSWGEYTDDFYRLVEKSRSDIGLPKTINFPLSVRY